MNEIEALRAEVDRLQCEAERLTAKADWLQRREYAKQLAACARYLQVYYGAGVEPRRDIMRDDNPADFTHEILWLAGALSEVLTGREPKDLADRYLNVRLRLRHVSDATEDQTFAAAAVALASELLK